jgi:hypothetical protein
LIEIVIVGACSFFYLDEDAAINSAPGHHYVACRWDYEDIAHSLRVPRSQVKRLLRNAEVVVTNPRNGRTALARVADWGPAEWTQRQADLSPALMHRLNLRTDEVVKVKVRMMTTKARPKKTYTIEWWPFKNEAQYVQHHEDLDEALKVLTRVSPARLLRTRDRALWSPLHQDFISIPKPRRIRRLTAIR